MLKYLSLTLLAIALAILCFVLFSCQGLSHFAEFGGDEQIQIHATPSPEDTQIAPSSPHHKPKKVKKKPLESFTGTHEA